MQGVSRTPSTWRRRSVVLAFLAKRQEEHAVREFQASQGRQRGFDPP
jgi:hypothetical protein